MNHSGQTLLIAALLFALLLVTVPVMVFINQRGTSHSVVSEKRLRGNGIADEGLEFSYQALISSWPYTNYLLPPAQTLSSAEGGSFALSFTSAPASSVLSYQVGVLAKPFDASGKVIPGSTAFALLSQRTLGAVLPSGASASAALELMHSPVFTGNAGLWVYFGPIVSHGTTTWTLDGVSDSQFRPRKFSSGGITGATAIRSETNPVTLSDQKEFWAYTSVGFPASISTTTYATMAQNTSCPALPTGCNPEPWEDPVHSPCIAVPSGSCYFPNIGAGGAIFNGSTTAGYSLSCSSCALFVVGNAVFQHVTLDVGKDGGNDGGIVVQGNLILDDNRDPASNPSTATSCPPQSVRCLDSNCATEPCTTTHYIDMRGFLYVTGNLSFSSPAWWSLDGAARVDGVMKMVDGQFQITYNDVVNHKIRTNNFELQQDRLEYRP